MRKDYNLEKRKYVIGGFIILIVFVYMIKLFELQICDSKYKTYADSNAFLKNLGACTQLLFNSRFISIFNSLPQSSIRGLFLVHSSMMMTKPVL